MLKWFILKEIVYLLDVINYISYARWTCFVLFLYFETRHTAKGYIDSILSLVVKKGRVLLVLILYSVRTTTTVLQPKSDTYPTVCVEF